MRQKKQTTKLKKFKNTKDAIKISEKIQLVQIRMLFIAILTILLIGLGISFIRDLCTNQRPTLDTNLKLN